MGLRRNSNTVDISGLTLGGNSPIRIQSMTTTNTLDTEATVAQSKRIIDAGGELVRITAQGLREAENLKNIKEQLVKDGYHQPLAADIHFNPKAAEIAALYVDKVRINPGNYVDKRAVFEKINYTEDEYQKELNELYAKFASFLKICRQHNTAVRIGTNHGSLSDRIMSRYGDTPEGMVESTMEFLRVCKKEDFNNVVISLKSSDPVVMVNSVLLLVVQMNNEDMHYPLHLGVTEAGEGEDGRIKSAVGIGALLGEGIGDTIRVSLTEEPEKEIPVAEKLAEYAAKRSEYSEPTLNVGNNAAMLAGFKTPIVFTDLSHHNIPDFNIPELTGYDKIGEEEWKPQLQASEFVYIDALGPGLSALPKDLHIAVPYAMWDVAHVYNRNACPLCSTEEYLSCECANAKYIFVEIDSKGDISQLKDDGTAVAVINFSNKELADAKRLATECTEKGIPVIAKVNYCEDNYEELALKSSLDLGAACLQRLCSGIWISNEHKAPQDSSTTINEERIKKLSFAILQAAKYRITSTEFVSCPGCGRTLFDLQTTVARVKQEFAHLKNLRIGVMGCIVNGPGEMGDVDYGYVGAAKGKITLYKGREVIKKQIPEESAIEELKKLIKANGDWREKK